METDTEHRFSTAAVREQDRFAYWREAVCDSYVLLDCETQTTGRFTGDIRLRRRDKLSTSFVSGSNQIVRRRLRDLARSDEESFLVSLQLSESGIIEQDGRMAHLQPGDFALYSSVGRYQLTLPDDFCQMVVQIPRDTLLRRLPSADRLTARTVSGKTAFGSLAAEMIPKLSDALDASVQTSARASGQDAIIDLLVSGLATLDAAPYTLARRDHQTLMRARHFIERNLDDPDMDRAAVARATGLSVRRLNELFQSDGSSISREIRTARLNRIASDLANPQLRGLSVSQIAYGRGIKNFQSFSRSFKSGFGLSPTDYRASRDI